MPVGSAILYINSQCASKTRKAAGKHRPLGREAGCMVSELGTVTFDSSATGQPRAAELTVLVCERTHVV